MASGAKRAVTMVAKRETAFLQGCVVPKPYTFNPNNEGLWFSRVVYGLVWMILMPTNHQEVQRVFLCLYKCQNIMAPKDRNLPAERNPRCTFSTSLTTRRTIPNLKRCWGPTQVPFLGTSLKIYHQLLAESLHQSLADLLRFSPASIYPLGHKRPNRC